MTTRLRSPLTANKRWSAERPPPLRCFLPRAGTSRLSPGFHVYGYDEYGNRWVSSSSGIVQLSVTPTNLNFFASNTQCPLSAPNPANCNRIVGNGYDAAGNQTQAGGGVFTYDAENKQTSVSITGMPGSTFTYGYDGEGRRVARTVYGKARTYVYGAGSELLAEYHNGTLAKEYVYAGGRMLAVEDFSGSGRSYLTTDHLGSTRLVTTASGAVESRHDYLPFGKEIPSNLGGRSGVAGYTATQNILQRFTGKEVDPETGLQYFGARYFSGRQGRFTGADEPFADQDESDPQTWNLYTYAANNPLLYVDFDGQQHAQYGGYVSPYYWSFGGCKLDGISTACSMVQSMLRMGGAVVAPNDAGSYRWNSDTNTLQRFEWAAEGSQAPPYYSLLLRSWVYQTATTQGWKWVDTSITLGNISNFAAGAGDSLSWGLTGVVNELTGAGDVIDRSSKSYWAGVATGTAVGIAQGPKGWWYGKNGIYNNRSPIAPLFRIGWGWHKVGNKAFPVFRAATGGRLFPGGRKLPWRGHIDLFSLR